MTKDETRAAAQIMLAWAEGKMVQIKGRHGGGWILDEPMNVRWNWQHFDYRIKPEPREFYVSLDQNGDPSAIYRNPYPGLICMKVREVIE